MGDNSFSTTARIDILPGGQPPYAGRSPAEPSRAASPGALRVGGQEFQQLLQNIYDGALIAKLDGAIVDSNRRMTRMLNRSRRELSTATIFDVIYGAAPALLDEILETLANDQFVLLQAACIRSDQTMFPAEIAVNRLELPPHAYLCFFVRDTTVRKDAEDRLRERSLAIRNAADGIAVATLDGAVTYANPAIAELWGVDDVERMVGRNLRDLVRNGDVADQIRGAIEHRLSWCGEVSCRTDQGNPFFVQLACAPNLDADDQLTGMVLSVTDVTNRILAERRLEGAMQELARSNQDLEQFAYAVSHDLQAPLRKIVAFSDMLNRSAGALPAESADYLQRMRDAAARMGALIVGLLEYSRVNTRGQVWELVDLSVVARAVVSDLDAAVREHEARIEVGVLPIVEAEPFQMRQLFQNLIGNAIKFHRARVPPHVRVTADEAAVVDATGRTCRRVAVMDNGIGFDPADAERIFGVFQRLHRRDDYEGTGIGLAICRKIVDRHGGEIQVTSTPGEGSCFTVRLPIRQGEAGGGRV